MEIPQEAKLLALARRLFPELTKAEETLFREAARGLPASSRHGADETVDLSMAGQWPAERVLRADRLAWLCADSEASALVSHHGIFVSAARIEGDLHLEYAHVPFPIRAQDCVFEGDLCLDDANLRTLILKNTWIQALRADGAKLEHGLYLRDGFKARGIVRLIGATLGGPFECEGGEFLNAQGPAINADRIKVTGGIFLRNGFKAAGEVRLLEAVIEGALDGKGGEFHCSNGVALGADRASITGSVMLRQGFAAEGQVRLSSAVIGGNLDCAGGHFRNGGALALHLGGARVQGFVFLRNGFEAEGEVRLASARIGGNLECDGGRFSVGDGYALNADGAKIEGYVFLRHGFKAQGEVRFTSAAVGGNLEAGAAEFLNPGKIALNGQMAAIEGTVFLREGCRAAGTVSFVAAEMGKAFQWSTMVAPQEAILDLRFARTGVLRDDAASWPAKGNLRLEGFAYDRIDSESPSDAAARLEWLRRATQPGFQPQPYEQLASVLRASGRDGDAREILIEKNREKARHTQGRWAWVWYNIFGKLIGYGYAPGRAFLASVFFVLLGTLLFYQGYDAGLMMRSKEGSSEPKKAASAQQQAVVAGSSVKDAFEYPEFRPFVYSLEEFTPLLKLHSGEYWLPNSRAHAQAYVLGIPITGSFLMGYLWVHIILGWLLTTLWVGSVTGLVKT